MPSDKIFRNNKLFFMFFISILTVLSFSSKLLLKLDIVLSSLFLIEEISLLKEKSGEYMITFDNLPEWATPVCFSFVVDDEMGQEKEYSLPSESKGDSLYIRVEDQEQEDAFLDRKEAYIGFTVSETQMDH